MKQMRLSKAFSAKMAAMALFLGMGQSVSAQQFTAKVPATNRFVMIPPMVSMCVDCQMPQVVR